MFNYRFNPIPYGGRFNRYGMGGGHRWFDFYQPDTDPGDGGGEPEAVEQTPYWMSGGSDGGDVAERNPGHHGTPFDQMTPQELMDFADKRNNGNFAQRNIEWGVPGFGLAGLIAGRAFAGLEKSQLSAALNAAGLGGMNPGDYVGGHVAGAANTGMNVAGGVPNPELAGRSDPSQSGPQIESEGNAGAWGGSGEKMANGGLRRKGGLPPPRFVKGAGDGRSDSVPGGRVRLSSGEFVWPADVVSAAGRGSSEAGAKKLGDMAMMLRKQNLRRTAALPPPGA